MRLLSQKKPGKLSDLYRVWPWYRLLDYVGTYMLRKWRLVGLASGGFGIFGYGVHARETGRTASPQTR